MMKLNGLKVFIAEDEAAIAMQLMDLVEDAQGDILGPFTTVSKCMTGLNGDRPDVAVLDVRLADGQVFPVADRLVEMNVPIVFHSGHANPGEIHDKYPLAGFLKKPLSYKTLTQTIEAAING
ncbi:response regulator [Pacificimonas sp. WHA3]|uniref:Response regulator n=1 Tax=Pacificimonas pallii TaxID=2827236 RepID=A0ABS6SG33_9SPHN|nr:response regulator [Pacificimonas pallii]MBV7257350.1 response regulator [Pacificimonas pallii]